MKMMLDLLLKMLVHITYEIYGNILLKSVYCRFEAFSRDITFFQCDSRGFFMIRATGCNVDNF